MLDRKSLVSSGHNFSPTLLNKIYQVSNLVEIICILESLMVASDHELQGDTKSRFYDYQNNDGYQNERSFEKIGSEVGLDREEKQSGCMFCSISNYLFKFRYNLLKYFCI